MITKKARFEVFKRDGFVCQYCGARPPDATLEVDHIHPVADGGGDDQDNLVTSCFDCNRGKSDRLLTAVPQSLSEKAAAASEREEQLRCYTEIMASIRERLEDEAWQVADILEPGASSGWSRAKFESVKRFVRELGVVKCIDAAEIAFCKKPYSEAQRFKYFCGICWRMIRPEAEE